MDNNELIHHGVKGMKWGVRRDRKTLAKLTGKKENDISEEDAFRFRKDIKSMRRKKLNTTTLDPSYANAVITQMKKEKVKKIVGASVTTAGMAAVTTWLTAKAAFALSDVVDGVKTVMDELPDVILYGG